MAEEDGRFRAADGSAILACRAGVKGPALLVVRPEDGRPATTHPENRMRGEVIDSTYHGRCWRPLLRVADDIVRLDWPRRENPGTAIEFSVPPERCTLLAI